MASTNKKGGKEAIKQQQWATREEIDNFQAWTNSPAISGIKARHADERQVEPRITPLSDSAAVAFLNRLLTSWLNWKVSQMP